jgi:predicted deacylase
MTMTLRALAILWRLILVLAGAARTAWPDDLPAGIVAANTAAATPFFVQESRVPGPTVLIVGGVHGDEPAGAAAADQIRHWPVAKGKLIVIPRANLPALDARKRTIPGLAASLNNLNRDFPKKDEPPEARGELAKALWKFVQEQKPDWLVDLHESGQLRANQTNGTGNTIIVFPDPAANAAVTAMLAAVNPPMTNASERFVRLRGPVAGSLARAAAEHLRAHAMIVETTIQSEPLSQRTRHHRVMVQALLKHLGLVNDSVTPEWMTDHAPPPGHLRVALYDAAGSRGAGVPRVLEQLGHETNVTVLHIGPEDICHGALAQFEVVMFAGGSGSGQAGALGLAGRAAVKQFVERGGGYIGICAGSYLACEGFSWGLKILDAKTVSPQWQRGRGTVKIELTAKGRELLGGPDGPFNCLYAQGPILMPAGAAGLPAYEPLALFRTEMAENNTPKGIMAGSPAVVAGACGQGRVLCFSPHPEQTKGLEKFVPQAVKWVGKHERP